MRRLLLTTILMLAAAPAIAVDFKAPIRSIDGTPVPISAEDKNPLTLGKVVEDALIATLPGDSPTVQEKGDRFRLALKVHSGAKDLSAEETVMLKKVVGMAYGPLVVGRVNELLEPLSSLTPPPK